MTSLFAAALAGLGFGLSLIVAIGALGMTMIIVSGGIDLSVGSVVALTGTIAASVMSVTGNIPLAVAVGVLPFVGSDYLYSAILVPFLVFAIGVSHGVQQINYIVREIACGKSVEQAARSSFSGLLIPGTLALVM